jgi:hypothetical protein
MREKGSGSWGLFGPLGGSNPASTVTPVLSTLADRRANRCDRPPTEAAYLYLTRIISECLHEWHSNMRFSKSPSGSISVTRMGVPHFVQGGFVGAVRRTSSLRDMLLSHLPYRRERSRVSQSPAPDQGSLPEMFCSLGL